MFLAEKKVTLDITSTSIRLLSVHGNRVERWASAPLEAGLIVDGIITEPIYLGSKIKNLMQSSGILTKRVIASVNGAYSLYRVVRLPIRNGHSKEQMLHDTAESVLPLPPDNFYISWKMLPANGRGDTALLIGMQPSVIDPEIEALKSIGVKPYIMNLKGMALLKLIDEPFALIANIESNSVDIVLVARGLPYIMRTVIRKEQISVADWAKDIATLLEQTVMFYNTRYRDQVNDAPLKCYLSGELADNEIVAGIIEDACEFTPSAFNVQLECPPNLPMHLYAVNLGLASKRTQIPLIAEEPETEELEPESIEIEALNEDESSNGQQ